MQSVHSEYLKLIVTITFFHLRKTVQYICIHAS